MIVFDDAGNNAGSEPMTILPYQSAERGEIDAFYVEPYCRVAEDIDDKDRYQVLLHVMEGYELFGAIPRDTLPMLEVLGIITASEYNAMVNDMTDEDIYDFLDVRKQEIWREYLIAQATLTWDYQDSGDIQDFQVFRSVSGSTLELYRTIEYESGDGFYFQDDDVEAGRRYIYQVLVRHQGGGYSKLSETKMVKIPVY